MAGMTSLLLLLWVGVAVSTKVDLQKRIIGGAPCVRPFHVKIVDEDGDLVCGGSLVSAKWILTAAHCWQWEMYAVLGSSPGVKIRAPPVMYADKQNYVHDIMLLELHSPVTGITPVDGPDCKKPPKIGDKVQIAGYGTTKPAPGEEKDGPESKTLQCANIKVEECIPEPYQFKFCAKSDGVDTCPGDSGGGVLYNNRIYGVHTTSGERACTRPAAFMDVCKYKDFIIKYIPNFFN